jgi:lysine 2,3-aminomutase
MTSLRTSRALIEAGFGPPEREGEWRAVGERYAIAVPPALAALIDRDDPDDPIARQFLPDGRELRRLPQERDDPIGDAARSPTRGLVHRYPDRVLLKLNAACAVYCRFCFRRESVGRGPAMLDAASLEAALDYIRARPAIWEVVLTGGDPLALSPRKLAEVSRALGAIAHVKVMRWHTRLPVAAPERVGEALIAALTRGHDKTVYVALHANHPRELTAEARAACRRLIEAGVAMVSQSVLLKGVNDDVETLEALMRGFVEIRVKPYYLHHPDLAPGTSHLRVTIAEGQALMRALRARVSGLAMPAYMLDLPARGKIPIGPSYLEGEAPDYVASDPGGGRTDYSDFG